MVEAVEEGAEDDVIGMVSWVGGRYWGAMSDGIVRRGGRGRR